MRPKYKVTGCARFFVFAIIFVPAVFFGAAYLRGENGVTIIKEFYHKVIGRSSEPVNDSGTPDMKNSSEPTSGPGTPGLEELRSELEKARLEIRELKLEIREKDAEIKLLKEQQGKSQ